MNSNPRIARQDGTVVAGRRVQLADGRAGDCAARSPPGAIGPHQYIVGAH
jgi:hypothetical protein